MILGSRNFWLRVFKATQDFDWVSEVENPLPANEVKAAVDRVVQDKGEVYFIRSVLVAFGLILLKLLDALSDPFLAVLALVLMLFVCIWIFDIIGDLDDCTFVKSGTLDAWTYSDYVQTVPSVRRFDKKLRTLNRKPFKGEVHVLPIIEARKESVKGTVLATSEE